jgi:hypothetical protein
VNFADHTIHHYSQLGGALRFRPDPCLDLALPTSLRCLTLSLLLVFIFGLALCVCRSQHSSGEDFLPSIDAKPLACLCSWNPVDPDRVHKTTLKHKRFFRNISEFAVDFNSVACYRLENLIFPFLFYEVYTVLLPATYPATYPATGSGKFRSDCVWLCAWATEGSSG